MCSWNFYVITSSMSCQLFLRVKLITWSRLLSDPRHWRGIPLKCLTACFSFSRGIQPCPSYVISLHQFLNPSSASVRMKYVGPTPCVHLCTRLTTFRPSVLSHVSTGYVHPPLLNLWWKRRHTCRYRQNWNSLGIWPGNQWPVQPLSLQRTIQIPR